MRIKAIGLICLGLFLVSAAGGSVRGAEEDVWPFSFGAEAGIYSSYIWRGLEVNDRGIFQPEAWISLAGFEAGIWGSLELTDTLDNRGKFTEVDYFFSYTHDFDFFRAALVYLYYDYPNIDEEKTQEVGIILETGEKILASAEVFWDFDQADGFYAKAAVGCSLEAGELLLTPSVGLGWGNGKYNDYYFGARKNALVDAEILLTAEADIYRGLYLTLTVGYFSLLESDLRREIEGARDGFWGGAALGFVY